MTNAFKFRYVRLLVKPKPIYSRKGTDIPFLFHYIYKRSPLRRTGKTPCFSGLLLFFFRTVICLFYFLRDKRRQIKTSRYDDIQSVDDQRYDNRIQTAENGR